MKIPSIKIPYRADDLDEGKLRQALLDKNEAERRYDNFGKDIFLNRNIDLIRDFMSEIRDNQGLGNKHSKYLKELKKREDQRKLEDDILKYEDREIARDLIQYPDFYTYDPKKGSFDQDNIDLVPEGFFEQQRFVNGEEVNRQKFDRLRSALRK
jgi:hypothetical protein